MLQSSSERRLGPIENPPRLEEGRIAIGRGQSVSEAAITAVLSTSVDADRLGLRGRLGLDDVPLRRSVAGEVGAEQLQWLVREAVVVPDELPDVEIEIRSDGLRWRGGDRSERFRPSGAIGLLRCDQRVEIADRQRARRGDRSAAPNSAFAPQDCEKIGRRSKRPRRSDSIGEY